MRLFALGAALLLVAMPVMAATDLHDASGSFAGLLDLIKLNANAWNGRLRSYAFSLFWLLVSIQMVLTFYPFLFKQLDFGELFAEIIRFMLTIGFFLALLQYSVVWAQAIIDSFRQAGGAASGTGVQLHPAEMFGLGVELAKMVGSAVTWNPVSATMIAIATVIILLSFVFIAAFMQVTLIEAYIVINASVLFMGFGGSQYTREYAISMLKYALAVGAKLFILTLIVGLVMLSARDWQAAYKHDETSMWTMVGLALVCAYLSKSVTDLIQGLITGVSSGGGSIIGSMAAAAVAGGVAGAAAASQIATSGMVSGGGVKDLLKSSFGGSPGGSSAGPSMNMNGGGSSSGPSSKVGGGGFGARAGSTPPASSSSSAGQPVKGAATSAAGMVQAVATSGAKSVAHLAEITVPGMEGAAQAFASPSVDGAPGPVVEDTPENVIRPAEDAPIDTMADLQEAMNKGKKS